MNKEKFENLYNKHYKTLLVIPAIILLFSFFYMFSFYQSNGDFFHKDLTLTGGTSITISGEIDGESLKIAVSDKLDEINTRKISDLTTQKQTGLIVQTKSSPEETQKVLEDYLGYKLTSENSSFEFIGSSLGESFYKQIMIAIAFAFLFMSIIVFILFRTFVPSTAVIISAFADIFMTLTMINLLGIKLSSAGIVAFLMLIGYSVDTDILLTTRILKRHEGTINERLFRAFKTGITMTLTSLLAIAIALFIAKSFSIVLTQIFTVLVIGLGFDIFNTWITNASIIKWYAERKK